MDTTRIQLHVNLSQPNLDVKSLQNDPQFFQIVIYSYSTYMFGFIHVYVVCMWIYMSVTILLSVLARVLRHTLNVIIRYK